jgi:hypothetical protein
MVVLYPKHFVSIHNMYTKYLCSCTLVDLHLYRYLSGTIYIYIYIYIYILFILKMLSSIIISIYLNILYIYVSEYSNTLYIHVFDIDLCYVFTDIQYINLLCSHHSHCFYLCIIHIHCIYYF